MTAEQQPPRVLTMDERVRRAWLRLLVVVAFVLALTHLLGDGDGPAPEDARARGRGAAPPVDATSTDDEAP